FYAYEEPKPAIFDVLANSFRGHKYEIKPLMNEIFRSAEFYSPDAIRTQVKSPVQWMIQTVKILTPETKPAGPMAANILRQLGQVPFAPPSVKGWDGGKAWITTSTLLLRYNLSSFALGGPINVQAMRNVGNNNKAMNRPDREVRTRSSIDFEKIAPADLRGDPKRLVAYITFRLFQSPLTPHDTGTFVRYVEDHKDNLNNETIRELLHLMMSTPQYQLT
ncbi:MAG: hypothetical protein QOD99_484, partial [Chthoniobacter sp.]|nr:hypothetical protein [Chthoniobacter sp.]